MRKHCEHAMLQNGSSTTQDHVPSWHTALKIVLTYSSRGIPLLSMSGLNALW